MKIRQHRDIVIDFKKERRRLKQYLKGDQRKRILHLIDLAENLKLDELFEAYADLPYDSVGEFPEQELVGEWFNYLLPKPEYNTFTGVVVVGRIEITQVI